MTAIAGYPEQTVVTPQPGQNQQDATGVRAREEIARHIVQSHQAGLLARRERDLISEKLLLHIDGSGDYQWADILYGDRVEIPRGVSEYRKTENVLRLVVDNAVAQHTTMQLHYFAEALPDRRSQDTATIDTLWMNYLAQVQDLNALFAEALYMAMPAGFCPVHRYWRDDDVTQHEPVQLGEGGQMAAVPTSGMIDCWVGNPFDTVFDRGARRGSVFSCSYGRLLSADIVRRAFSHVKGIENLEGSRNIPSAAQFQRIARKWQTESLAAHGSPVTSYRRNHGDQGDELISVICREILPGVEADYPEGRLQAVGIKGDPDREGRRTGAGLLLVDQPLPAGDFSWTNFYSHHRLDDIHGKPWVEDLDQLQIDLNFAISKEWEVLNRMIEAPIVAPGGALSDDMMNLGGYDVIEIDPSLGAWRPQVMQWPREILPAIRALIAEKREAIFTGGGYQAVSRGENPGSRTPYRAIVALQEADRTIHGPVNERYRRSATDFARGCWKQMKAFGDTPWLINVVGDEYSYLAEPYIDNSRLSNRAPQYKLVNAFGTSPELKAQEILELAQLRGADGQVFLSTEEARRQYPNQFIFDKAGDPATVARRRAKHVAAQVHSMARRIREQTNLQETDINHPQVKEAAMFVFTILEQQFPRLRDDDLGAHIRTLSEITQDESADPIARMAAMQRQDLYYQWQAQMSMQGMPAQGPGQVGPGGPAQQEALGPATVNAENQAQAAGAGPPMQ